MGDTKYRVFKLGEAVFDEHRGSYVFVEGDALDDAVVIRTHDIFASAGLYAYAYNIHTWCEVERLDLAGTPRHQEAERFDRLDRAIAIADYFIERAYEAEAREDSKFPD